MTEAPNKTRVGYFIAAYGPLDEKTENLIWERVHRGGYGPDDPFSMQIAHDAIFEARMKANIAAAAHLPVQIQKAVDASISAVQAAQAQAQSEYAEKIAHQIADKTRSSLVESMPGLEARLVQGARSRGAFAHVLWVFSVLLVIALAGISGFAFGRVTTADLDLQFAEQAGRPDAAAWLNLQRINGDLDSLIAKNCLPGQTGYINDSSGQAACHIPLWLESASAPTPISYFAHAKGFIVAALAKISYEGALVLGLVVAAAGIAIRAVIKARVISKGAKTS